jgi:diguanylate cyclase (GGDEF)-like protein/PAS domain S-box-containing protein
VTDAVAVPLIVLSPNRDAVEIVNRVMRNAGEAVHCTWIPAVRDLGEALEQLNPELLICAQAADADFAGAAEARDQLAPQVPLVMLVEQAGEEDIVRGMRAGARDVVTQGNYDRVQAVLVRELRAFRLERALNSTVQSARDYRKQLETVLQRSADAIAQVQEGIVVEANDAWLELFGFADESAVVGQPLMDLFDDSAHAALKGALIACLQGRWSDHTLKAAALLADGSQLDLEFVLAPGEFDDERSVRLVVPARKRDDKQLASELADAVRRDPSTGLLYRRPLLEAVADRITTPLAGGMRAIALIRPDKFAAIEKNLGVLASEQFVADFGASIKSQLGAKDILGRFGGVMFLALLERGNAHDVEAWGDQLLARVRKTSYTIGQNSIAATCSIGLAAVPASDANLDAIVADALDALRRARTQGGNQSYQVDRADADTRVQAYDKIWVKHIKAALMENRFRLVQQPVASLQGDDPEMFDVLVRMLDHQGKEVLPAEFMAAATRNDLLKNIDRWVIGASLSFAAQRKPGCLFVRLSKDSVIDTSFPEWLSGQVRANPGHSQRICFQVTEEIAESYLEPTKVLFAALRKAQFRTALERFGSGRDPQKLLEQLPLDFIKIDGALVQDLAGNFDTQQKVKGIVDRATKRSVETIAERVEDANTMAVLWQLGVQFIQGYFVNVPEQVVINA